MVHIIISAMLAYNNHYYLKQFVYKLLDEEASNNQRQAIRKRPTFPDFRS